MTALQVSRKRLSARIHGFAALLGTVGRKTSRRLIPVGSRPGFQLAAPATLATLVTAYQGYPWLIGQPTSHVSLSHYQRKVVRVSSVSEVFQGTLISHGSAGLPIDHTRVWHLCEDTHAFAHRSTRDSSLTENAAFMHNIVAVLSRLLARTRGLVGRRVFKGK